MINIKKSRFSQRAKLNRLMLINFLSMVMINDENIHKKIEPDKRNLISHINLALKNTLKIVLSKHLGQNYYSPVY